MSTNLRKHFLFVLVALLLTLGLVACEPAEESPGVVETPILGVETPVFDETPVVVETPIVDETPMVEETPLVEETPVVDETPMVEETPVVDETPAVEETPDVTGGITDTAGIVRSSTLIGLPIETADGEQVAEVADVLIDQQGAIQYLIFDAGGFLGIGERTSAVDWELFESDAQEAGTTEGTTDDGRVLLYLGQAADLETSPEIDAALLEEDDLVLDAETLDLETEFDSLIQVSEFGSGVFNLTGYTLVNAQDEDLGEIQELIFDLSQGQVLYVVADIGGFLGIGANQVAIPWDQLQLDEENQNFVLDAEQETLENAPTINLDEWEEGSPTDSTWDTDISDFWENNA